MQHVFYCPLSQSESVPSGTDAYVRLRDILKDDLLDAVDNSFDLSYKIKNQLDQHSIPAQL